MKAIGITLLSSLLVALAPHAAKAGGFAIAGQGGSASGTGGAGTARADDASAAWYNPAALADGAGARLGIGVVAAKPTLTATAADDTWRKDSESGWSTPPHLHVSAAWLDGVVGLYAGVPFGSGVTWPADWPGRYEVVKTNLEIYRVAPFVGWRFGDLRIAAGAHVDLGRLRINRKLDFIDTDGDVAVDMSGRGIGGDLALFYQATPQLALGLAYKSRSTVAVSGGANFTAPNAFAEKTPDQDATAEISIPDRVALGGRWLQDSWAVSADIEVTNWEVYDELVVDFANEATPDAVQTNNWRSTVALRGGGEWSFARGWVGRAGAYYDPSPTRSDTIAPSSPDSSRVGLTVGMSRDLGERIKVDLFYEYMALLGREAESEKSFGAHYGGDAQLLGLSLRLEPTLEE